MFIFYDFETSSRELLGQILSYSFIVTDDRYRIIDECNGLIKVKRTELPEIGAIETNYLKISDLEKNGLYEYEAAERIYKFLLKQITTHHMCYLIGYNSNQFDLGFLRNLLIRYGLNPYFSGKLINLDLLHWMQHLAFTQESKFPWTLNDSSETPYYSFKLEDLSNQFNLLDTPQTHQAKDDVLLCIELVKTCETEFSTSLAEFNPIQFPSTPLLKQKVRDYSNPPKHFTYTYWTPLIDAKKTKLLVNITAYQDLLQNNASPTEEDYLKTLKYLNLNKHFFVTEPCDSNESSLLELALEDIRQNPFFKSITLDRYFETTKKPWDIDYQIHNLGFDRIETLRHEITTFFQSPENYLPQLNRLLKHRISEKDNYLIQLFNRVYLNFHSNPNPAYLMKYLEPRYITGTMLRNQDNFTSLDDYEKTLTAKLQNPEITPEKKEALTELNHVFQTFKTHFQTKQH